MNAKPELVVASASKPSAGEDLAEPASQGFGITNGSPSWSARNRSPFSLLRRWHASHHAHTDRWRAGGTRREAGAATNVRAASGALWPCRPSRTL